jgi:mRNA interferase MazF
MNSPNRSEVWLVDLSFAAKIRPCLVLSAQAPDEDRALVTVIPHTTSPRGTRFEVEVKTGFLKKGVFDAQNLVTIPYARLARKLGALTDEEMLGIEDAVCDWLGI